MRIDKMQEIFITGSDLCNTISQKDTDVSQKKFFPRILQITELVQRDKIMKQYFEILLTRDKSYSGTRKKLRKHVEKYIKKAGEDLKTNSIVISFLESIRKKDKSSLINEKKDQPKISKKDLNVISEKDQPEYPEFSIVDDSVVEYIDKENQLENELKIIRKYAQQPKKIERVTKVKQNDLYLIFAKCPRYSKEDGAANH